MSFFILSPQSASGLDPTLPHSYHFLLLFQNEKTNRHRIGTDTAVVYKERYGVIIVGAESIGHLGRVSSGALL